MRHKIGALLPLIFNRTSSIIQLALNSLNITFLLVHGLKPVALISITYLEVLHGAPHSILLQVLLSAL